MHLIHLDNFLQHVIILTCSLVSLRYSSPFSSLKSSQLTELRVVWSSLVKILWEQLPDIKKTMIIKIVDTVRFLCCISRDTWRDTPENWFSKFSCSDHVGQCISLSANASYLLQHEKLTVANAFSLQILFHIVKHCSHVFYVCVQPSCAASSSDLLTTSVPRPRIP